MTVVYMQWWILSDLWTEISEKEEMFPIRAGWHCLRQSSNDLIYCIQIQLYDGSKKNLKKSLVFMTHRKRHMIFWRWPKWVDGQCGRLSSYFEILETTTPTTSAAALFHCLKQWTTTAGWKGLESRNPSRTTWRFIRWQTWKNFLSVQIKIQKEIAHHSPFNVLRYHTVIHQGKEADKLTSWGKTYCDQGLSANIQRDTSLHLPKKKKMQLQERQIC